jgi:four helix bundle protein
MPSNIAEGFKRRTNKDFAHFVNIAESSLEETKYGLLLSLDLGYLKKAEFESLSDKCDEVGRMLNGLYKKLNPYDLLLIENA